MNPWLAVKAGRTLSLTKEQVIKRAGITEEQYEDGAARLDENDRQANELSRYAERKEEFMREMERIVEVYRDHRAPEDYARVAALLDYVRGEL